MAEPDLEHIALDCLVRLETEGDMALEAACAMHPHHAARLRGMVAQLRRMGLVSGADEPTPERLGSYRLLGRIGAGGMGVVHLAEDERLGRQVALKLMRGAYLADPRSRERFHREVEAVARLEHPGICTVYEADEVDGVPFLAMRHIDGETLAARIHRWREEQRRVGATAARNAALQRIGSAVTAVRQVAEAVHAAHEHDVIHRDLKPGNIVFDSSGQPVVLDFGLARLADAAQSHLTRTGDQLGTPAYMAPEQVSGDADADARTDLYALGAMLYEAVALRPPFDEARREVLYRRILTEEPPDPRSPEPQVGRDLSAVIAKAMAKEPRRRYATARELAEELRRIEVGEPVQARHPGPMARMVRWSRRNRAAAVTLAAVSIALVVSLVALRARAVAMQELEVIAVLRLADEVRSDDPLLAYKYAREALHRDRSATRLEVVGRMQEILFELPDTKEIGRLEGTVHRVLWSPDGQAVLATGPLVPAALFRIDGSLVHKFEQPTQHAAWHPEGGRLALVARNLRSVQRFRYTDGKVEPLGEPLPEEQMITSLAWARDGRLLVSRQKGATLWLPDDTAVHLEHQATGEFWQGAFFPDGRILAAGGLWSPKREALQPLDTAMLGEDDVYKVLAGNGFFVTGIGQANLIRRALFWTEDGHPGPRIDALGRDGNSSLSAFSISPDGKRALVGSQDGALWLRREDGSLVRWQSAGSRSILAARFHENGILVSDFSGAVHQLDDELRHILTRRVPGGLYDLAVDPHDPTRFATAGADGALRLWQVGARPGTPGLEVERPFLATDPQGRLLVAGADGTACLLDDEGNRLAQQSIPSGYAFPAFHPDGTQAVFACSDGTVHLWDLATNEMKWLVTVRGSCDRPVSFLDDSILVTAHRVVWRCSLAGNQEPVPQRMPGAVLALALDARSGVAFVGTWPGIVVSVTLRGEWRMDELTRIESGMPIPSLALSADGSRLLAGCTDGNVYVIDTRDGTEEWRLTGHRHGVTDVAFGPDERSVATAAMDGRVRIFDLPPAGATPGELSPRLTLRHDRATQARFLGPDRLVTAGGREVRFWALTRRELLERETDFGAAGLEPDERAHLERLLRGRESR